MIIEEFLEQYTTVELEKCTREGINPMGGANSPFKVPGRRSPKVETRTPSPKKLLHRVNASPVHGSKSN